jgi:hypothetical protein
LFDGALKALLVLSKGDSKQKMTGSFAAVSIYLVVNPP